MNYPYGNFAPYSPVQPFYGQGNVNYPPVTQTPPSAPQSGPELVTVQTINQVEQVGIQPGQRRIVMVQNEPVIAVRAADQMGLATTEYYRLEKFDPAAVRTAPADYVTRKEFEDFVASVKAARKEAEV